MKDHHRPIPPPAASSASSSARRHSGTALAAAGAGAPSSPGVGTEEPRLLPTSLPQPPQPQRQPQLQPQPQPPARQSQQLQLPQPFLFESWSIDRSDPSSSTQLPSSSSAIQHSPSPSSSSSSSSRNHPDLQSPSSATTNLLASLLSSAPSSAPSKTSAAVGQTSSFKYFVRRWSCATCRARKVKCDGARPRCSNCAKRDQSTVCYYDQDSMNNQALAGPSSTRRSVKGPVRERRVGTTDSMDTKMGGDAEALRLDPNNLADLLARTRLVENLFRPSIYSEADEGSPVLSVKLPVRPDALPNEEAMLVEGFFRSPQWGLQVVHRLSLLRNWESEPAILKAAICAVGASDPTMLLPKSVMMWYYDFSRSQFSEACDVPSLKILQALLILGIQSYVIGKVSAARNVLGTACRMALFLDLNVDPDDLSHPLSVIDGEIRRRCWWSCYTLEQYVSTNTSKIPYFPRKSWPVKFICPEPVWQSLDPSFVDAIVPMSEGCWFDSFVWLLEINYDTTVIVDSLRKSAMSVVKLEEKTALELTLLLAKLECWRLMSGRDHWINVDEAEFWLLRASREDPTTWRWFVSIFYLHHESVLLLALPSLFRYLPTLISLRHSQFDPMDTALASKNLVSQEHLGISHQTFLRGVSAAVSIAKLFTAVNRSNLYFASYGVLSVIVAADFLALAESALQVAAMVLPESSLTSATDRLDMVMTATELQTLLAGVVEAFGGLRRARPMFGAPYERFQRLAASDWDYFDSDNACQSSTSSKDSPSTAYLSASSPDSNLSSDSSLLFIGFPDSPRHIPDFHATEPAAPGEPAPTSAASSKTVSGITPLPSWPTIRTAPPVTTLVTLIRAAREAVSWGIPPTQNPLYPPPPPPQPPLAASSHRAFAPPHPPAPPHPRAPPDRTIPHALPPPPPPPTRASDDATLNAADALPPLPPPQPIAHAEEWDRYFDVLFPNLSAPFAAGATVPAAAAPPAGADPLSALQPRALALPGLPSPQSSADTPKTPDEDRWIF